MYAITGITGKVGGALARALLADGQPVRAVVRAADKGHAWAERGCEVALALESLGQQGVEGTQLAGRKRGPLHRLRE